MQLHLEILEFLQSIKKRIIFRKWLYLNLILLSFFFLFSAIILFSLLCYSRVIFLNFYLPLLLGMFCSAIILSLAGLIYVVFSTSEAVVAEEADLVLNSKDRFLSILSAKLDTQIGSATISLLESQLKSLILVFPNDKLPTIVPSKKNLKILTLFFLLFLVVGTSIIWKLNHFNYPESYKVISRLIKDKKFSPIILDKAQQLLSKIESQSSDQVVLDEIDDLQAQILQEQQEQEDLVHKLEQQSSDKLEKKDSNQKRKDDLANDQLDQEKQQKDASNESSQKDESKSASEDSSAEKQDADAKQNKSSQKKEENSGENSAEESAEKKKSQQEQDGENSEGDSEGDSGDRGGSTGSESDGENSSKENNAQGEKDGSQGQSGDSGQKSKEDKTKEGESNSNSNDASSNGKSEQKKDSSQGKENQSENAQAGDEGKSESEGLGKAGEQDQAGSKNPSQKAGQQGQGGGADKQGDPNSQLSQQLDKLKEELQNNKDSQSKGDSEKSKQKQGSENNKDKNSQSSSGSGSAPASKKPKASSTPSSDKNGSQSENKDVGEGDKTGSAGDRGDQKSDPQGTGGESSDNLEVGYKDVRLKQDMQGADLRSLSSEQVNQINKGKSGGAYKTNSAEEDSSDSSLSADLDKQPVPLEYEDLLQ